MSASFPLEVVRGGKKGNKVVLFLLKTKSTPHDVYEEHFSKEGTLNGCDASPTFVPVLEHTLIEDGMRKVRTLLRDKKINPSGDEDTYGGAVFTSQRAVEAFAKLVEEEPPVKGSVSWPYMTGIPVYTVGPATSLALKSIKTRQPMQIFGSECGNGEALAHYMLDHYSKWHEDLQIRTGKLPPVLFLVGETRRDIIPKTLMNKELPEMSQIRVDEVEVYGTGVMESFEEHFTDLLKRSKIERIRWVVIFSPTGCEAALRALGILDPETKKARAKEDYVKSRGHIYVATIGPTTRDYLMKEYDYTPDVVCKKPSPEGISEAITAYMDERGITGDASLTA